MWSVKCHMTLRSASSQQKLYMAMISFMVASLQIVCSVQMNYCLCRGGSTIGLLLYSSTNRHSLPLVIACGALATPPNGRVTYIDGTGFGQSAAYSCNSGYYLMGASIRTCQLVGWSESEPTCQRMLQL